MVYMHTTHYLEKITAQSSFPDIKPKVFLNFSWANTLTIQTDGIHLKLKLKGNYIYNISHSVPALLKG